jgi:hypothetical protein
MIRTVSVSLGTGREAVIDFNALRTFSFGA